MEWPESTEERIENMPDDDYFTERDTKKWNVVFWLPSGNPSPNKRKYNKSQTTKRWWIEYWLGVLVLVWLYQPASHLRPKQTNQVARLRFSNGFDHYSVSRRCLDSSRVQQAMASLSTQMPVHKCQVCTPHAIVM